MSITTSAKIDRAAVIRMAWRFARQSRESRAERAFNGQWGRWQISSGAERPKTPEDFLAVEKLDFGSALRAAWDQAKRDAREAAYSSERKAAIEAAELDLMAAQAIDCTAVAMPAIRAAEIRLANLKAA